jgi:hypothetical protein
VTEQFDRVLIKWDKLGAYEDIRDLGDGTFVMAHRLMFHWMLVRGYMDAGVLESYFDRWCYATEELVRDALAAFPVNPVADYEPAGWHRHPPTHRRRPGGDPAQEYIDP